VALGNSLPQNSLYRDAPTARKYNLGMAPAFYETVFS